MTDSFFTGGGVTVADLEAAEPVEQKVEPKKKKPTKASSKPAAANVRRKRVAAGRQRLYFDLETLPDYSRLESFGLPPVPEPQPIAAIEKCPVPSSVVDGTVPQIKDVIAQLNPPPEWLQGLHAAEKAAKSRAGVFAAIKEAVNSGGVAAAAIAERRKLLSTTPEYCRVAAMGWAVGDGDVQHLLAVQPSSEREILEMFWDLAAEVSPLVGFNIVGFDLPVIFVRSAILKVPSTKMIDMRPWGDGVCDLYAKRFQGRGNYGSGRPGKLKDLAALAEIEIPAGDVDGSQVEELMEKDPALVGKYVCSDVEITRELHRFYSGYFCT